MINPLLEHSFNYSPECLNFGLIVGIHTDLTDGLYCSQFSEIVILIFRFCADFSMNELKFTLRGCIKLPNFDLLAEVSFENTIDYAQGSASTVANHSL